MEDTLKRSLSPIDRLTPAYWGTLVVSGLILTLANVSVHSSYADAMLQAFKLYVYVVATLFLLYLLVGIHHYLGKGLHLVNQGQPGNGSKTGRTIKTTHLYLSTVKTHKDQQRAYDKAVLPVVYHGPFMNSLLTVALLLLGLGSAIKEILVIYQSYRHHENLCFVWSVVAAGLLRLSVYLVQTGTLIKHARIFINFRYRTIRLGLGHVLAANLVMFLTDVIQKSNDDLQPDSAELIRMGTNSSSAEVLCREGQETPLFRGMEYLYIVNTQYALLGAGLVYKIYCRVGTTIANPNKEGANSMMTQLERTRGQVCHSLAIILGVCLFAAAGAAGVRFIVHHESGDQDAGFMSSVIYLASDMSCNFLGLIVGIAILGIHRKLKFIEVKDVVFEDSLLNVSYIGAFGFILLVAVGQVVSAATQGLAIVTSFHLAASLLSIIQGALQVAVIKDGLWRSPYTLEQARKKPGRSLVVLLIFLNLSMWLINVLELQNLWLESTPHKAHYGPLVWALGINLLLPCAALFRLHSALSLGAIWCRAYEMPTEIAEAADENEIPIQPQDGEAAPRAGFHDRRPDQAAYNRGGHRTDDFSRY